MKPKTSDHCGADLELCDLQYKLEEESLSKGKADAKRKVLALSGREKWLEGFQLGYELAFEYSFYRAIHEMVCYTGSLGLLEPETTEHELRTVRAGNSPSSRLRKAWHNFEYSFQTLERAFQDLRRTLCQRKESDSSGSLNVDPKSAQAIDKSLRDSCKRTRAAFLRLSRISAGLPSLPAELSETRADDVLSEW
jgi:hypothetical protein